MAAVHDKITKRKLRVYATWNHSWSDVCHMAAAYDKITQRKVLVYAT